MRFGLVAHSEPMRDVVEQLETLAADDRPVLLEGEPGSGRELIARLLHHLGPRQKGQFISVKASAVPRNWLDGSSRSALRMAQGGTLLVKDMCELPRASQRRLGAIVRKRAGTDGAGASRFDVRVLGACDPDAVHETLYQREFFQEMTAQRVRVPPLRERQGDIVPLTEHFVRKYARELDRKGMSVSTRVHDRLASYAWPGNVAELQSVSRRLVARARGSRIEVGDIDEVLPQVTVRAPLEEIAFEDMVRSKLASFLSRVDGYDVTGFYNDVMSRVERPLLELIMERTGGNQVQAARVLGLNRNTLRRKLSDHGLL